MSHLPPNVIGMAVTVEWTSYGTDAGAALAGAVAAAKQGEPLAPVTVVVPSNSVGVAARRQLARGTFGPAAGGAPGLVAVNFLTLYRLAELLGAPSLAASGRRPVSTPVLAAAVRAVLAAEPGLFAPVAGHAATQAALVATHRELRDLSPRALEALAAASARAGEVVRVHREVAARLAPRWYDEHDLVREAITTVSGGGPVAAQLGALVVHLPQEVRRHTAALVGAIAARSPVHVVAGATGNVRADADVRAAIARITDASAPGFDLRDGGEVEPPPAVVPAGDAGAAAAGGANGEAGAAGAAPAAGGPAEIGGPAGSPSAAGNLGAAKRIRFVTTSDADDEVRAAVRLVVGAARSGTTLDRIAILYAAREPYTRLVAEHLGAAGVPFNGPAVVPLAGRVAGRTLLGLLDLAEPGYRRPDVFAWLASSPLLHGRRPVPLARWERVSREAAVVAGRADWDVRLAAYADTRQAEAARAAAGGPGPVRAVAEHGDAAADVRRRMADRARRDADAARSLRAFIVDLIDEMEQAGADRGSHRSWSAHAGWALRQLDRLLGGAAQWSRWPEAERRAAEAVEQAVARVAALDEVEGAVPLGVFARTLRLELESGLGRVGRLGDGVLTGTVGAGLGVDLDLTVVLGLVEGSFPARVVDDGLLPDHERERCGGELALRRARGDRQHHDLLAVLAGSRQAVLCAPRGDLRRTTGLVASRWMLELASAVAGDRWWSDDLWAARDGAVIHVPSFAGGIRGAAAATAQEERLRVLLTDPRTTSDPVLAAGAAAIAARRSSCFTRFDGRVDGVALPSPAASVTSPTRLERWASCPFAYFVGEVLGARPTRNPEAVLFITPLDKGELVHQVLEQFVLESIRGAGPAGPCPEAGRPWTRAHHARLRGIGEDWCDRYEAAGLTGRPLFWRRDRRVILDDLDRLLATDDDRRRAIRARPVAAELRFGSGAGPAGAGATGAGALPPVEVTLPGGRVVAFRGAADRVDQASDGTLHVVDYKTGRSDKYRKVSGADPDLRGTVLQLPVYAEAARRLAGRPDAAVVAEYWFVSQRENFNRYGYAVTPAVLDHFSRTLGSIVSGIEAGVFPHRPSDKASTSPWPDCAFCDPDGLGVVDLRRAWEAKRADPAMAVYATLAAPADQEADDGG